MTPLRIALAMTAVGLVACCFGIGDLGVPNIDTAGVYTLLENSMATCGDAGASSDVNTILIQFSGSGSSLNYTSEDGCNFDFNVSNNVGTLSNAPVDCSVTNDGGTAQISVTSYTLNFSDAGGDPQLAIAETSTFTQGGVTCQVTISGSGAQ